MLCVCGGIVCVCVHGIVCMCCVLRASLRSAGWRRRTPAKRSRTSCLLVPALCCISPAMGARRTARTTSFLLTAARPRLQVGSVSIGLPYRTVHLVWCRMLVYVKAMFVHCTQAPLCLSPCSPATASAPTNHVAVLVMSCSLRHEEHMRGPGLDGASPGGEGPLGTGVHLSGRMPLQCHGRRLQEQVHALAVHWGMGVWLHLLRCWSAIAVCVAEVWRRETWTRLGLVGCLLRDWRALGVTGDDRLM